MVFRRREEGQREEREKWQNGICGQGTNCSRLGDAPPLTSAQTFVGVLLADSLSSLQCVVRVGQVDLQGSHPNLRSQITCIYIST